MVYSLVIAGSTEHTKLVADAIAHDSRFKITGVITPSPRAVGRKQTIAPNPLHQFSLDNSIPAVLVEQRLDQLVKEQVADTFGDINQPFCDFLLVIDFGYYVPSWLLKTARFVPLNIHPSKLPRWRGSSPGQFTLLHGDHTSAVSLITVAKQMDQGDVWHQIDFAVDQNWTAAKYYAFAFQLIAPQMPNVLAGIATNSQTAAAQPIDSPTPLAIRFKKSDSFVPWSVLMATNISSVVEKSKLGIQAQTDILETITAAQKNNETPPLLAEMLQKTPAESWATVLERAVRAFQPWPKVWSLAPTAKGTQRIIVLETRQAGNQLEYLQLQLEGKNPASYNQLKTSFSSVQ